MIKLNLTALLYSDKNIDLAYKSKKICRDFKINLINVVDFVDLTLKTIQVKPQILFFDLTTVRLDKQIVKLFTTKGNYFIPNIILLYENEEDVKEYEEFGFDIAKHNCLKELLKVKEKTLKFNAVVNQYQQEVMANCCNDLNNCLMDMGFSPKHTGYAYLIESMKILYKKNGNLGSLCNDIYPLVAARFETRVINVERNIRNAIVCAWERDGIGEVKDSKSLLNIFKVRPTNREFIYMCIEYLKNTQIKSKIL